MPLDAKILFAGQDSHLTVTLKQNVPRVECTASDKPPDALSCEYVLDDMPASKVQQVFGNRDAAGIDVPIPWTVATRKRDPYLLKAFLSNC